MEKGIITLLNQHESFDKAIADLRAVGVETVWENSIICSSRDPKVVIPQVQGYDYIFAGGEIWNKEVFDACPTVKLIIRLGVGHEGINLDDATAAGVPVTYMPGFNSQSVAEQSVALMLSVQRQIPKMNALLHAGDKKSANFCTFMLSGKTVGILGFGNIGKRVARILNGFGCKVLAYDIVSDSKAAEEFGVEMTSLDDIFARSNVISVHLPLLPETRHIICKENIAKMKDGVVIINTSRGGTIDSADLEEALKSCKVAGAGLDVFEDEGGQQKTVGARFAPYPNVIMTPHVSGSTQETFDAMMKQAVETVLFFREGKNLPYLLNPGWKRGNQL